MSHSSWYALEAVGTERATSDSGNFLLVGNRSNLVPSSSPLFSSSIPYFFPFQTVFFFFSLRLTNVACQILFGSYPVIQIIAWHFGCIYRGAAAFMQRLKSNSRQLWPWARTWPQCTQLLVTSPPTLSFGLVSCVRIKWHNNGARPRCLGEEKASVKVIGVKKKKRKSIYLVVYLVQTWD